MAMTGDISRWYPRRSDSASEVDLLMTRVAGLWQMMANLQAQRQQNMNEQARIAIERERLKSEKELLPFKKEELSAIALERRASARLQNVQADVEERLVDDRENLMAAQADRERLQGDLIAAEAEMTRLQAVALNNKNAEMFMESILTGGFAQASQNYLMTVQSTDQLLGAALESESKQWFDLIPLFVNDEVFEEGAQGRQLKKGWEDVDLRGALGEIAGAYKESQVVGGTGDFLWHMRDLVVNDKDKAAWGSMSTEEKQRRMIYLIAEDMNNISKLDKTSVKAIEPYRAQLRKGAKYSDLDFTYVKGKITPGEMPRDGMDKLYQIANTRYTINDYQRTVEMANKGLIGSKEIYLTARSLIDNYGKPLPDMTPEDFKKISRELSVHVVSNKNISPHMKVGWVETARQVQAEMDAEEAREKAYKTSFEKNFPKPRYPGEVSPEERLAVDVSQLKGGSTGTGEMIGGSSGVGIGESSQAVGRYNPEWLFYNRGERNIVGDIRSLVESGVNTGEPIALQRRMGAPAGAAQEVIGFFGGDLSKRIYESITPEFLRPRLIEPDTTFVK